MRLKLKVAKKSPLASQRLSFYSSSQLVTIPREIPRIPWSPSSRANMSGKGKPHDVIVQPDWSQTRCPHKVNWSRATTSLMPFANVKFWWKTSSTVLRVYSLCFYRHENKIIPLLWPFSHMRTANRVVKYTEHVWDMKYNNKFKYAKRVSDEQHE
jgi:hypothetical protein